jgi:transcriptional regulator with XRE-family HTH domain
MEETSVGSPQRDGFAPPAGARHLDTNGPSSFAGWLRRELEVRRISQRVLASRCGVDHSTISRLLTSSRAPSLATAMKLAAGLRPLGTGEVVWLHGLSARARRGDGPADVLAALAEDPQLSPAQVAQVHDYYLGVRSRAYRRASRCSGAVDSGE